MQSLATSKAKTILTPSDDGIVIARTQDVEPIIDDVKARRSAGLVGSNEMRHVARVPTVLVEAAANEAGVELSDKEAVRELIYKKIMSGEWSKFAVHEGGY